MIKVAETDEQDQATSLFGRGLAEQMHKILTADAYFCTFNCTVRGVVVKQLSLTEARAKLSSLVAEVDKGKGPIAIAQRSKVKALLVNPEWHGRVEEELAHYRSRSKHSPLKLRGSMTLTGDLDEALQELKKEREQSLQKVIASFK